jgi:hypothetical protein
MGIRTRTIAFPFFGALCRHERDAATLNVIIVLTILFLFSRGRIFPPP